MPNSHVTFGIQTGQQEAQWGEFRDCWLELEELGFDDLWVYDHYLPTGTRVQDGAVDDAWALLAALSQVVKRPRLGTMVTSMTFRHPVVLAKMATTVDHASAGRVILGLGTGWYEPEHSAYGIPYPSLKQRMDRLGEAAQLIKMLWTEPRTNFQGKHFQITDAPFEPKPVQKPHPPILIGGGGERRTLNLVARYADNWNWIPTAPLEAYKHKLSVLREHCAAVGRDPAEIQQSLNPDFFISDDPKRIDQVLQVNARSAGKRVEEIRDSWIAGNPEEVRKKLQAFIDLGVTSFVFALRPPFDGASKAKVPDLSQRMMRYHTTMDDVRRLAKEVLPALRPGVRL